MLMALIATICTMVPTDLQESRKTYEAFQQVEKSGMKTKEEVLKNAGVNSYEELVSKTKTLGERAAGFFTFVNIVQFTAAAIVVVACGWLFGIYFISLLMLIPIIGWEVLLYLLSFALTIGGSYMDETWQMSLVLPGCFVLVGALLLTLHQHFDRTDNYRLRECAFGTIGAICFVVWLVVAVYYQSYVIGFMSILALLNAVGFYVAFGPLCIYLGFERDSAVMRGTFAGFVLLVIYCTLTLLHIETKALTVFMPALQFMGAFVYFLGLLIMSSTWYWNRGWGYWPLQILTIVSGVIALFLGTVFGMSSLLGVGGTFFYIYLIEKYCEFSWKAAGWAWGLLGLGGLLYAFVYIAKAYPQYFIF